MDARRFLLGVPDTEDTALGVNIRGDLLLLFRRTEEFDQGEGVDVALVNAAHGQAAPADLFQHLDQLERAAPDAVQPAAAESARERRREQPGFDQPGELRFRETGRGGVLGVAPGGQFGAPPGKRRGAGDQIHPQAVGGLIVGERFIHARTGCGQRMSRESVRCHAVLRVRQAFKMPQERGQRHSASLRSNEAGARRLPGEVRWIEGRTSAACSMGEVAGWWYRGAMPHLIVTGPPLSGRSEPSCDSAERW